MPGACLAQGLTPVVKFERDAARFLRWIGSGGPKRGTTPRETLYRLFESGGGPPRSRANGRHGDLEGIGKFARNSLRDPPLLRFGKRFRVFCNAGGEASRACLQMMRASGHIVR